jgi:hypothetical protein
VSEFLLKEKFFNFSPLVLRMPRVEYSVCVCNVHIQFSWFRAVHCLILREPLDTWFLCASSNMSLCLPLSIRTNVKRFIYYYHYYYYYEKILYAEKINACCVERPCRIKNNKGYTRSLIVDVGFKVWILTFNIKVIKFQLLKGLMLNVNEQSHSIWCMACTLISAL